MYNSERKRRAIIEKLKRKTGKGVTSEDVNMRRMRGYLGINLFLGVNVTSPARLAGCGMATLVMVRKNNTVAKMNKAEP